MSGTDDPDEEGPGDEPTDGEEVDASTGEGLAGGSAKQADASSSRRLDAFAVCDHAAMALGAWLPWVRTDPTGFVPMSYITGMDSGLETLGAVVLPLAVLGGLVHALPDGWRRVFRDRGAGVLPDSLARRGVPGADSDGRSVGHRWTLSRAVAAVAIAIGGYYVITYPPFSGAFRAGSGVYLTLGGAFVVLATAHLARQPASSPPKATS